jgi:CBS domain-containing protein
MGLTARDIMMPLSQCVAQSDTLVEASRHLAESHFVPLPIVGDGQLMGLLKNAHLVAAIAEGRDLAETRVADVTRIKEGEFSANGASIPADSTLNAVRQAMTERQVGQVLVMEGDEPIGVVTHADMRSYAEKAPDGLPMPPPRLLRMVIGGGGDALERRVLPKAFYESGARVAGRIEAILRRRDLDLAQFDAILEFGCGCGRIIRHWKDLDNARLYGAD